MPGDLRRFLTGSPAQARRALRSIWLTLASDDGYIDSDGLVTLTATAVAESIEELDATGRSRAAQLLNHTAHEIWLNIYGQPADEVVEALRERLPLIRRLLGEQDAQTVSRAARLLVRLRVRSRSAAFRLVAVFGREHDPWRRGSMIGCMAKLGGRDTLPFLIDEVFLNDPEFVVRGRAACAVAWLLGQKTPTGQKSVRAEGEERQVTATGAGVGPPSRGGPNALPLGSRQLPRCPALLWPPPARTDL